MRLGSLGDTDIRVLSGRSKGLAANEAPTRGFPSWGGLLNHFRRQVLKIAI